MPETTQGVAVDRFTWERGLRDPRLTLTPAQLALLSVLGGFMNRDGSGRVPQPTLAAAARVSERSVRRHLDHGYALGLLARTARGHRRGDGSGWSSRYQLTLPHALATDAAPSTGHVVSGGCDSQPAKPGVSTGQTGASTGQPGGRPPRQFSKPVVQARAHELVDEPPTPRAREVGLVHLRAGLAAFQAGDFAALRGDDDDTLEDTGSEAHR